MTLFRIFAEKAGQNDTKNPDTVQQRVVAAQEPGFYAGIVTL
jgi:hypothetical protein